MAGLGPTLYLRKNQRVGLDAEGIPAAKVRPYWKGAVESEQENLQGVLGNIPNGYV